jgi:hypothetical protein
LQFWKGHGKVIEKTLPEQSVLDARGVLGIVPFGGTEGIQTPYLPDSIGTLSLFLVLFRFYSCLELDI